MNKPPAGLALRAHMTLVKLYADQTNTVINCKIEYNGHIIPFNSNDPIPSYKEIVERYGKTKREIEQGLE